MSTTFEQIKKANEAIITTPIKGKEYAEVNQRIKVFRMLYPMGTIETELIMDDGEKCMFRALVSTEEGKLLGTGTAYELKSSSFINKTSYIENCETSAVGRALAMCGIGIDVSIASYEEVGNAMENQDKKKSEPVAEDAAKAREVSRDEMLETIYIKYPKGSDQLANLVKYFNVDSIEKASTAQLIAVFDKCKK